MNAATCFSRCRKYRYRLTRGVGYLMPVVMLNPSTADAVVDDPTIRRLLGFAARGLRAYPSQAPVRYDGIDVVNLYGLRATNPKDMLAAADPYGPDNDAHLAAFCQWYRNQPIIVAWGTHARREAVDRFLAIAREHSAAGRLVCFGYTQAGHPRHPLYLSYSQPLVRYQGARPSADR